MSLSGKEFKKQILKMGEEIYKKVNAFVQENKGDDELLYRNAILKLSDGREMLYSLESYSFGGEIDMSNYTWNEELKRGYGDLMHIMTKSAYGFAFYVNLSYLDKNNIRFEATDKKYPHNRPLSDEEKEEILLYVTQLYEQVSTLKYDKEKTHSIDNYTYEVRRKYNIKRFKEEMVKLHETNPESTILPSVETAVNWWINELTGSRLGDWIGDDYNSFLTSVDEKQINVFRESLSKKIMEKLSQGATGELDVDYGPSGMLADAIIESKISGIKFPLKTHMTIDIDSVKVKYGYEAKFEEIYAIENKDEDAKKKVK